MTDAHPYLTTGEVADMFRVTRNTVIRWCNTGQLQCVRKPSGRRMIARTEVEQLLRTEQEQVPHLVLVDSA